MHIDTLITAAWIIPVEPDGVVLEDHALAVDAGRILDILPRREALDKYHAGGRVDLPAHALIPGLINGHTHAPMVLLRGIADDLPLMRWLHEHIWPLEKRWVGEAFVGDGTDLAMAEMIRGGVTCFNDMYFFADVAARRVLQAGMRASLGLIVVEFPSAWAGDSDEYLSKGLAFRDAVRGEALISTPFAPHAPYSVSDRSFERLRTLADELDLPVHIHLHETRDEVAHSLDQCAMRPLARLQKLGLVGPPLMAVHMTQIEDVEIALLAEAGASVIHCPESNLKLASGFCPVAKLLAAGVNVALGTDGAASNNDLDLFGEMRTAALLGKAVAGDAAAVPARAVLRMATLNGAKALGREAEIGSLERGKFADIAAVRLDALETQPLFDPVSQIVYAGNRCQVTDVWVAGCRLLQDRELTTLDTEDLRRRVARWQVKLKQSDLSLRGGKA